MKNKKATIRLAKNRIVAIYRSFCEMTQKLIQFPAIVLQFPFRFEMGAFGCKMGTAGCKTGSLGAA